MNAFLRIIKIQLLTMIAIVHVHLSMFTPENPLNPSSWVILFFESPPLDRWGFSLILENSLIIAIQCVVTTLFAIYLLTWKKARVWLASCFLCVLLYFEIWKLVDIPFENAINQVYDRVYGYGRALERCITFSIIQIVYISIYMLITNMTSRKAKTDGPP